MKPNFSLYMSTDGLHLSHREGAVWNPVGTVSLETDNLAADLAALRRSAAALEPEGLRCKLVLPDDQIRYLGFSAEGLTKEECTAAAVRMLDGATPYSIEELIFDTACQDGHCCVAAVARETLEEAESFAIAHRLDPVCFAAMPASAPFPWEPFFGPAGAAARESADMTGAEQAEQDGNGETSPAPVFVSKRDAADLVPSPGVLASEALQYATRRYSVPGFAEAQAHFSGKSRKAAPPSRDRSDLTRQPQRPQQMNEADRLTVFGARGATEARSTRHHHVRLIAAGLAFVVLSMGAWSAGLLPASLSSMLSDSADSDAAIMKTQFASPIQPLAIDKEVFGAPQETFPPVDKVLPARATLTDEDSAVLDALGSPLRAEPDVLPPRDAAQAHSGIDPVWVQPPLVESTPAAAELSHVFVSQTNPVEARRSSVGLPDVMDQAVDIALVAPSAPAPAAPRETVEQQDLVSPVPDGDATTSDGDPQTASLSPTDAPGSGETVADPRFAPIAEIRPVTRPEQADTEEAAGTTAEARSGLAAFRPRMRPEASQEATRANASLVPLDASTTPASRAAAASTAVTGGTARAIAQSLRPDARPSDFDRIVATSRSIASTAGSLGAPAPVRTASVAPQTVAPKIPSSTSARRESTVKNAINLRKVNLIGVYGKPSDRRALVRLANGRYEKVQVGDRFDGGRISAIGDDELRYQKSGRNLVLKMPKG